MSHQFPCGDRLGPTGLKKLKRRIQKQTHTTLIDLFGDLDGFFCDDCLQLQAALLIFDDSLRLLLVCRDPNQTAEQIQVARDQILRRILSGYELEVVSVLEPPVDCGPEQPPGGSDG